jgi:hypothetical protein
MYLAFIGMVGMVLAIGVAVVWIHFRDRQA